MDYNTAYHLHCEITMKCGRAITLQDLHQMQTYAGLSVGTPSNETNNRHVEWTIKRAKQLHSLNSDPILIPPRRTKHFRESGDMDHIPGNSKGYRPTEWMPMITSVGFFHSIQPTKNSELDASTCVIIWFQDEFGLPTIKFINENMKNLDWDSYAVDYQW